MNSLWDIKPTPNDIRGVQQSLEDRPRIQTQILINSKVPNFYDKMVSMKLSGDGTKIGKRLHVVIFTFTLLEEEQYCSSVGNHVLVILKQPGSYDCLKSTSVDIITDVKRLTDITVDGIKICNIFLVGIGNF